MQRALSYLFQLNCLQLNILPKRGVFWGTIYTDLSEDHLSHPRQHWLGVENEFRNGRQSLKVVRSVPKVRCCSFSGAAREMHAESYLTREGAGGMNAPAPTIPPPRAAWGGLCI